MADPGLREWLGWFDGLTAHQRYEQVTSSLIRLNQLAHDPETALVLGQQHGTFSLTEAIEGNRVVLAALSSARLGPAAYLLGGFLSTELVRAMMRRITRPFERRRRVYTVFDEFDQIVPESACDLISQAGKAGCALTLIGQARGMLDPRLRDAVVANCPNRVIFGVAGAEALEIAQEIFEPDPQLVKRMTGDQRPIYYTPQEQWTFYAARIRELSPHTCLVVTLEDPQPQLLTLPAFDPPPAERLEAARRSVLPRYTRRAPRPSGSYESDAESWISGTGRYLRICRPRWVRRLPNRSGTRLIRAAVPVAVWRTGARKRGLSVGVRVGGKADGIVCFT